VLSLTTRLFYPLFRTVYTLLIINKAGGLVYNRDFSAPPNPSSAQKISTNDYLVLAGTFHGVHAITKSLTPRIPLPNQTSSSNNNNPNPSSSNASNPLNKSSSQNLTATTTVPNPSLPASGIESLESSFFRLTCFQTHTGTKFLLITDPLMPNVDSVMKGVYERYADHVMKNPFYQMEMPVRIEGWERVIGQWLGGR
jgi:trafficking protein particle complex subunit 4